MKSPQGQSLLSLALQKFKKRFWGVFSLGYIVFCALIALLAYMISPDHSKNANQMNLSIHSKPPGFKTLVLEIPRKDTEDSTWQSWFTGQEQSDKIIPIQTYTIKKDKVEITPFDKTAPTENIDFNNFKIHL